MTTNTKKYSIGKIKQLIDLNGDSTNFDIMFRVVSTDKKPFDLLVVDQATLDNNPSLPYKKVDQGEISGRVNQTKNMFQNYFLILKADEPCECEVEINKKELPKHIEQPTPTPPPSQQMLATNNSNTNKNNSDPPKAGMSLKKILIIVGIIVLFAGGFYYFYTKSKKDDIQTTPVLNPTTTVVTQPLPQSQPEFKFSSPEQIAAPRGGGNANNKLLERLKSLNLN